MPEPAQRTEQGREGPLPVVGRALEPIYRAVIGIRNRRFDRGVGVERVGVPVISVGNLSVGGTGKTPMVMHVLGALLRAGCSPCVAMRGYTARGHGQHTPDETDAYRRAFPAVPIVARPDRIVGVRALLGSAGCTVDCVVLDDGFQHRQIGRELDIVLVDATPRRSIFADRLLPGGWLREPVGSLRRASSVVLTHAELADESHIRELSTRIEGVHGRPPIGVTRHLWTAFKQASAGGVMLGRGDQGGGGAQDVMLPLDIVQGRRVLGCCAIGHPEAFFRSLRMIVGKAELVHEIALADHDPYVPTTIERIARAAEKHRAEWIVVSDKDWSKLRGLNADRWPCPVVRPDLALVFDSGREELDRAVREASVRGAARRVAGA